MAQRWRWASHEHAGGRGRGKRKHTQAARLSGSVFSLGQNRTGPQKGLTTFTLLENAFAGAPSYASCTAKRARIALTDPGAQIAKLSPTVLQTLSASDHGGKFRTTGRYSAATVRGTMWQTEDRCDGNADSGQARVGQRAGFPHA